MGEYRTPGVEWQPEVAQTQVQGTTPPPDYRAIYYETSTSTYWHVVKDPQTGTKSWMPVSKETMDKVNADKAYINMPNQSTYWFLNPQKIYFGMKLSFSL